MNFPGHFEPDTNDPGPSYISSARRPWSPIQYDEDITDNHGIHNYFAQDQIPGSLLRGHRYNKRERDASENSVEALDLADYARTLRRPTTDHNNPYPPFPHTSHVHPLSVPSPVYANGQAVPQLPPFASFPEYPPSPDNSRPFSAQSRDTFNQPPPSLVSGDTSHDTHDSSGSRYPYPPRRPYSLPPFFASTDTDHLPHRGPAIFSATSGSPHQSLVRIASPIFDEPARGDLSRFPAFSRSWYEDPRKDSLHKHTSLPPYLSFNTQYNSGGSSNAFPSTTSNQSRDILPWSSHLSDVDGPPVDDSIKQERLRMLENEFGKKGKSEGESFERTIGSVNQNGVLITPGPKKRVGARWAQGILSLATAVSALYGALFIKSPTPAPPASKPPAFALYILSVVTIVFVFYFFALRPCFGSRRRKATGSAGPNMDGMMVLPVQGMPGGKDKKNKKGKKNKHDGGGGDVHVNLIVDPTMFGPGRDEEYDSEGGYDDVDGSQVSSRRRGGRGQARQRRSIFQGLAMESDWKAARKLLKQMLLIDIVCLILWAGVFILVLFGRKCPPGGFNGWCNSYNIASATACILSVAFGFSVYFDIVDLHVSKTSPRTRT